MSPDISHPKRWTRWLFLILISLSACAAPLSPPSPAPSPQPLRVQSDPVFEPLQPLLAGCVPPGLALYFVQPGQTADLALSLSARTNPAGPVFILGSEEILLVVNPSNPLASISRAVLQQVYAGKFNNWDPLGGKNIPLSAWAYPPGGSIQSFIAESLLQPAALSAPIHITPGPRELRSAVAGNPGGLGFLPRSWLDSSVRVLPISDAAPGTFTLPLLVVSKEQPQGGIKDFLLCVQEGLKNPIGQPMPITVIFRKDHLEIPTPKTVGEALETLGLLPEQYMVIYRGALVTVDQALTDGDSIRLVGVISGGS